MFNFSWFGEEDKTSASDASILKHLYDTKLSEGEKLAHINTCLSNPETRGYSTHENFLALALTLDNLDAFTALAKKLNKEAVFWKTSLHESWLITALDDHRLDFLIAFFQNSPMLTLLNPNDDFVYIQTLFDFFVMALENPRHYGLIDCMITHMIKPWLNSENKEAFKQHLREKGIDVILAIAKHARDRPNKSTQLLGLLIHHGLIRYKMEKNQITLGWLQRAVLVTKLQQHQVAASGYFKYLIPLLNTAFYRRNKDQTVAIFLHIHYYFHRKQEGIRSKTELNTFEAKMNEWLTLLKIIYENDQPAEAIHELIAEKTHQHPGKSDLRTVLIPLYYCDDEALKSGYEGYKAYLMETLSKNDANASLPISPELIISALYHIRSNPFEALDSYLDIPRFTEAHQRKRQFFDSVITLLQGGTTRDDLVAHLNEHGYRIHSAHATPSNPPAPISAVPAKRHTGQFANLLIALKRWDFSELQLKLTAYQNNKKHKNTDAHNNLFFACASYLFGERSEQKYAQKEDLFIQLITAIAKQEPIVDALRKANYLPAENPGFFAVPQHRGQFATYMKRLGQMDEAALREEYQAFQVRMQALTIEKIKNPVLRRIKNDVLPAVTRMPRPQS